MRRQIIAVLGVSFLSVLALAAPPKKILVVDMKAAEAVEATALNPILCKAVFDDKRFDSACQQDVKSVLQYDQLGSMMGAGAPCAGDDCAERIAERVKADVLLTSSLAKLDAKSKKGSYVLTLKLIRISDAKVLGEVQEKVDGSLKAVSERIPGATKKLLAKIK